MDKIQLPNVTLICADGVNHKRAINVLEHCKSLCDFGDVKLLTHFDTDYIHAVKIMPLNSLVAYSIFCLTKLHEYIDTPMLLCVQRDGWILNPQSWNNDWLNYDYIAPLFVQHDDVGSGGFSLRSKRLMQATAKRIGKWDGTQAEADRLQVEKARCYEDGVISLNMDRNEFKFAPHEEAGKFAQGGNKNLAYFNPFPFGFHGDKQNINHETGEVSPVCIHGGEDCDCRTEHQKKLMEIEGKNIAREIGKDENGRRFPFDENNSLNIEVIKISKPMCWYRDKIGETFVVDRHEDRKHYRWKQSTVNMFEIEDTKII